VPRTSNLLAPVVDRCDVCRRRYHLQEMDLLQVRTAHGGLGEVDSDREALIGGHGGDRRHAVVEAVLVLELPTTFTIAKKTVFQNLIF
jgi:hypothetical protein